MKSFKDIDIKLLLKKAEELRALFVLGELVIPFIEEIFVFVSEIQPLFKEINAAIEDNIKKMPKASKQLSKVNEANELATNEIMDIVDGLFNKTAQVTENLNKMKGANEDTLQLPKKVVDIIAGALADTQGEKANTIKQEIEAHKQANKDEFDAAYNETNEVIQSIVNDSNNIMMSLQVQDITAQQIAAVSNLLETVQDKLAGILDKFNNINVADINDMKVNPAVTRAISESRVANMHRRIAYDPEAIDAITNKDSRQESVDSLIDAFEHNELDLQSEVVADPSEVDAMFEVANATANTETEEQAPEVSAPVLSDEDGMDAVSQDDIDALFNSL